jgi:hypothetical protein
MKRLFALLLVVNIGLFGWGYYDSQRRTEAKPLGGGNLELLAEREAAEARPGPEGYALERERVAEPEPAETPPAESPGQASEAPAEPGAAAGAAAEQAGAEESAAAEPPQPPPRAAVVPSAPEPHLRRCHALGPFAARDDAESVAARLASIGLAATLRDDLVQRQTSFWVMIPPMESRDRARAMEQRLRDAGFEDIWRVVDGDMENAISLGLYSREAGAKRRLEQARSQDIPAEIRTRRSEAEEFWLDFPADRDVDTEALKRRLARDYPDIRIVERDCVRVDTP